MFTVGMCDCAGGGEKKDASRARPGKITAVGPGRVILGTSANTSSRYINRAGVQQELLFFSGSALMRWIQVKAIIFYWCLLLNPNQLQRRRTQIKRGRRAGEGFKALRQLGCGLCNRNLYIILYFLCFLKKGWGKNWYRNIKYYFPLWYVIDKLIIDIFIETCPEDCFSHTDFMMSSIAASLFGNTMWAGLSGITMSVFQLMKQWKRKTRHTFGVSCLEAQVFCLEYIIMLLFYTRIHLF